MREQQDVRREGGNVGKEFVVESQNGGYVLLEVPSIGNSLENEHIGSSILEESNFYREGFVVHFFKVGN